MDLYPLTKPQNSIWNMEQFYGESIANITGTIMFNEAVEIQALKEALKKTIEQCDSLRIRPKIQNGIPMQYIDASLPREFDLIEFSSKDELDIWVEVLARKPFELNGDLFKFFIISVDKQ